MSREIGGIAGILGQITSRPKPVESRAEKAKEPSPPKKEKNPVVEPEPYDKPAAKTYARRGRLPGQKDNPAIPKEKVSVWIPSALIESYRDWSWDARCNLSDLIEHAMDEYSKKNR